MYPLFYSLKIRKPKIGHRHFRAALLRNTFQAAYGPLNHLGVARQ